MTLEEKLKDEEKKEKYVILLVDDESDIKEALRNLLENDYSIIEASNGREAIIQVQKHDPDLIIFDIKMPDMDGIKMAMALNDMGYGYIPKIALSGQPEYCSKEDVEKLTSPIYYFEKGIIEKNETNMINVFLEITKNGVRFRKKIKEAERIKYLENLLIQHLGLRSAEKALRDKNKGDYKGERKNISVLITDITNFSKITSKTEPELLFNQLQEYNRQLTNIIGNKFGSMIKDQGDGVMTFWGAPYDEKDHVEYACQAALDIKKAVKELNDEWEKKNLPRFETRIGISSGEVISGRTGSGYGYNYNIYGDPVNIAKRIEELNKIYGTSILISEETFSQLPEGFTAREINTHLLRGIEKEITIYELIDYTNRISDETRELIKNYSKALDFYKQNKLVEAFNIFHELAKNDSPSKIMLGYVIDKIKNSNE